MHETQNTGPARPHVPLWKTWGLRILFALIVGVMGTYQWSQIFAGTADWTAWKGVGHTMLASLALVSLAGVFHPLKLLPVMLFEIAWKSLWLLAIALPAWLDQRPIPDILDLWPTVIGIPIMLAVVPWRYVWWLYFRQPVEPWRSAA